jgi:predicted acyltransferase
MVKPLVIMGMNAIAIYLASEFLDEFLSWTHWHDWIFRNLFAWIGTPYDASLAYAVAYVGLMYLLAWVLYRRKIFLKI